MSVKTNIEWATSTGNPWIGCTKVSPGCKHCYAAELDASRFSKTMGGGTKENPISHWGKGAPRVLTKAFWTDAVKWNANADICLCGLSLDGQPECERCGKSRPPHPRIFPSLCDWLDDEVPVEWLADFLKLIHDTPNLDWLLLTKRPENFESRMQAILSPRDYASLAQIGAADWLVGNAPQNVWIGVSVEDQKRADERIPLLLQIPAKVRFLSVEPLLSSVNLRGPGACWLYGPQIIDWVIVGGESGTQRRDCGVEAICDVARQCVAAGVPCFVKQDSAFKPGQQGRIPANIWSLKQFPEL